MISPQCGSSLASVNMFSVTGVWKGIGKASFDDLVARYEPFTGELAGDSFLSKIDLKKLDISSIWTQIH